MILIHMVYTALHLVAVVSGEGQCIARLERGEQGEVRFEGVGREVVFEDYDV